MIRYVLTAAVAALVLATPVAAKRAIRAFTPIEKLVRVDAVVVGKVTAIEKDTVDVAPAPGADKVTYKVAVIKVESGLAGAANVTHVKVAFVPPAPVDPAAPVPPGRGVGPPRVNFTVGLDGLFYLTKLPGGEYYAVNPMFPPAEVAAGGYKEQVALVTRGAAVLADPAKALTAEKPGDRSFAAVVMVTKYRAYPESGAAVNVKVPADESRLVLKALAEGSWKADPADPQAPAAYQAFGQLGLTDADGWKPPVVKPGEDYTEKTREAFAAWVAGAGKDYQINKFVVKKK